MLWDLSRVPHAVSKFSQPDGRMISLVTAALLEASPCEFYLSHQVSLVETASKYSWDLQSDYLVAEKMGAVGKHIISFPTILLLAVRFWCAMSPPFPLESLPQYIASKQLQGFQDSLNCSYSQDGGWDSHPADHSQPLCTGMWHPGFPNVRMLVLGWAGCTYDDGGLVTAWVNPTGTPPAVLKSCWRSAGLELCCNRIQLGHVLTSCLKYL